METEEDSVETSNKATIICCPRCKSRDVVLGEDKEGFFWIFLCNNCGYRGKEGDKTGCIDKKNEPTHVREE